MRVACDLTLTLNLINTKNMEGGNASVDVGIVVRGDRIIDRTGIRAPDTLNPLRVR
jgi:hypothetical protein